MGWGRSNNKHLLRKLGKIQSHVIPEPMPSLTDLKVGVGQQAAATEKVALPLFSSAILCPDATFRPTANKSGGALKPVFRNCDSLGPC
jgi:hypothetical protein